MGVIIAKHWQNTLQVVGQLAFKGSAGGKESKKSYNGDTA
jgi:hypothetical protein